jgi:hypothetical protein
MPKNGIAAISGICQGQDIWVADPDAAAAPFQ